MARLAPADTATLQDRLETSERTFRPWKRKLPRAECPHTRRSVRGLLAAGVAALRPLLATGQRIALSTNRLESIWRRGLLRPKQIGRRWSPPGALHRLAACLGSALHPKRTAAARRGEPLPQVVVLITSLDTGWAS